MNTIIDALRKESDRIREDSEHSANSHFTAASGWRNVTLILGIPSIALAATVSGTSALSQSAPLNAIAICSLIAAVLTSLITFLNPSEKATAHLISGNKYNSLRNNARIFIEIDSIGSATEEDLTIQLKNLSCERDTLNQDSPPIPRWAYLLGRKRLRAGEKKYAVDNK